MIESPAEILREYGPFPGAQHVHGLTFDGQHVWFASGDRLNAFDPESGMIVRTIDADAHAGTAFDGRHLFQLFEKRIQKIDPKTGQVLATIPAPGNGGDSVSGYSLHGDRSRDWSGGCGHRPSMLFHSFRNVALCAAYSSQSLG